MWTTILFFRSIEIEWHVHIYDILQQLFSSLLAFFCGVDHACVNTFSFTIMHPTLNEQTIVSFSLTNGYLSVILSSPPMNIIN
jgi:hypothetical protein